MKRIVPAIIVASVGLSLVAQTTGSMQGKVVDSKGKAVAGSKITISRIGINWTKDLIPNAQGKFFQVGFVPGDYNITVSAPGHVSIQEMYHIGLGIIQKDFVLWKPEEVPSNGTTSTPSDPSAMAEAKGLDSFNKAVGLYNEKNYIEALPLFESALQNLNESLEKTTDVAAKSELGKKLMTIERPYAFSLVAVGKIDEAKRAEYFAKAEPMLRKSIEMTPKDQNALISLLEIATAKNDVNAIKKYQASLDSLLGPRPELAYNQGVELYNAGKLAEAKPFFLKSLGVKADFADAYYLLAMCEFSENNLKGTKANLQKYIELAPTGKHAAEVKAMLADPSLKNIK